MYYEQNLFHFEVNFYIFTMARFLTGTFRGGGASCYMSVLFRFCHGGCFLKGRFVHTCISAWLATQFKISSSLFRIQGKFQNGMVDPLSNFYFIPTIGPVHSWHELKALNKEPN